MPLNLIRAVVDSDSPQMDFIAREVLARNRKVVGIYRLGMELGSDSFRDSFILGVVQRLPSGGVEVKLAGIGEAIHRPMRTYSSGMGARLRFSIAAAAQPSILLIDEALGTGDAAFADRSRRKIDELRAGAGTIFLVSHAAQTIEEMCTRAIWLHKGELVIDGDAAQVARAYRWWAHCVARDDEAAAQEAFRRALQGDPIVPTGSG